MRTSARPAGSPRLVELRIISGWCKDFMTLWAVLVAVLTAVGCNGSASGQPYFGRAVNQLVMTAQTTNPVPSICVATGKKGTVNYSF
jgi:hypothetical protein